ncbi:MAG TPA: hypothetical protein VF939_28220 [Puia sp.]
MKSLPFVALIGCFFTVSTAIAQIECSGVYLTANDFVAGKLLPATDGRPRSRTAEEQIMNCKYVFVNQGGHHHIMNVRDVYALRSCEGKIVRMYNDGYYTLLNPGENILLYVVVCNPVSKGNVLRRKYYFSKDAGSEIEDLTLDNLKAAFRDNQAFHQAVEAQFRADKDLYAYDNAYKCYRLNRIYTISK